MIKCASLKIHVIIKGINYELEDIVERALDSTVSTRNTIINKCCISDRYVEILRSRDGRNELTGPAGKNDNPGEKGDKDEPGTSGEQGIQGPPGPISAGALLQDGGELPVQALQEHNYCILV